ncbi:hypothetical protein [Sphingomonas faeni]|uniref:hypothetical protein n=1 Tax=Sphingomonas faeni TaxID=185950 RepID=UPI002413A866|nr:hypothetical protein [Sphingomonas faeni]
MTSIAVALSVDSRGPSALYILTDSRITWGPKDRWEGGQKAFASRRFPDVFGYFGDAYFPSMMLRQLIEQLDSGLVCRDEASADERHEAILQVMKVAMSRTSGRPPITNFTIFHGSRMSHEMQSRFSVWESCFNAATLQWTDVEHDIVKDGSYLILAGGTGSIYVNSSKEEWEKSPAAGTSRSTVWAFFDAIRSTFDTLSGANPQIVGIWRIGPARTFGIHWNDVPYFAGLRVSGGLSSEQVRWFDSDFEPCDHLGRRLKPEKAHLKPDIDVIEALRKRHVRPR